MDQFTWYPSQFPILNRSSRQNYTILILTFSFNLNFFEICVFHIGKKSIDSKINSNPNAGLTLTTYYKKIKKINNRQFWYDNQKSKKIFIREWERKKESKSDMIFHIVVVFNNLRLSYSKCIHFANLFRFAHLFFFFSLYLNCLVYFH